MKYAKRMIFLVLLMWLAAASNSQEAMLASVIVSLICLLGTAYLLNK